MERSIYWANIIDRILRVGHLEVAVLVFALD